MAQMFEFKKVTIGPRALTAQVELAPSAPLRTSENPEAVERVLALMPGIADHVCLGDAAPTFGEVIRDTELAHLLEHASVELLAQSDIAGDVARGQTLQTGERTFEVTLGCADDVLVTGALSSAAWILQWAFSGGGDPAPSVEATVAGLVSLVGELSAQEPVASALEPVESVEKDDEVAEPEAAPEPEVAPEAEPEPAPVAEPAEDPDATVITAPVEAPTEEPEPALEPASAEEPAAEPEPDTTPEPETPVQPTGWDMDDVPRPHLVR